LNVPNTRSSFSTEQAQDLFCVRFILLHLRHERGGGVGFRYGPINQPMNKTSIVSP
jgi:hypothetical protein